MTSELKSDLRYFGYKDGHYISECKTCGCLFLGAKRSWACKPCAEKKAIEPKVTRPVPDVPELVRYRLNSLGELVYSEKGSYVLHSQAAEIISADRAEKHRAQEAVLKLERELAQYKAQEPVGYFDGKVDYGVGGSAIIGIDTSTKDGRTKPLYASPAPAADLKAEVSKEIDGYIELYKNQEKVSRSHVLKGLSELRNRMNKKGESNV